MGLSNGLKTVSKPVEYVLKTVLVLEEPEFKARLSVCEVCDKYNSESSRCQMCGCYMNWKAQIKHARCPVGKW
jgi:hypothetical protein